MMNLSSSSLGLHLGLLLLRLANRVGNKPSNLSNGDSLTLVTKSEAAHLGVIFEPLNTDVANGSGDLEASDDVHALLGEARRLLALAVGLGLELVQEGGESDF